MANLTLRKKIYAMLEKVEDEKLPSIYTVVSDEINKSPETWDASFIEELEKRSASINDNSAKTYSWEETKSAALKKIKYPKQ
jgi:hypothetical protein